MAEQWDMLTSLQEGTLASHSVLPGSKEARQTTVTSGRNLLALYERLGPVGSLARMLLDISTWASTVCWLTWKDLATPGKRLLFRLVPSMPRTDEIGFGLWRTPDANMGERGPKSQEMYEECLKTGKHAITLNDQVNGPLNPTWVEWLMGYPENWTYTED